MTDLPEPVRVNGEYEYAYTATQMREYRNQALEEAAKVCDEHEAYPSLTPRHCADAIRALKEHTQQAITEPAEIRRVFELDDATWPDPDSGFSKLGDL